jgi:hypothetical protein
MLNNGEVRHSKHDVLCEMTHCQNAKSTSGECATVHVPEVDAF